MKRHEHRSQRQPRGTVSMCRLPMAGQAAVIELAPAESHGYYRPDLLYA